MSILPSTTPTAYVQPNTHTLYQASLQDATGAASINSGSITVDVTSTSPLAINSYNASSYTINQGQYSTLSISFSGGTAPYQITWPDGASTSTSSTSANYNLYPATSGNYTTSVIDSNGTGVTSSPINITVANQLAGTLSDLEYIIPSGYYKLQLDIQNGTPLILYPGMELPMGLCLQEMFLRLAITIIWHHHTLTTIAPVLQIAATRNLIVRIPTL